MTTDHWTKWCDVHFSPDDGGWYAACYHFQCGWTGELRGHEMTAIDDARDHSVTHGGRS